MGHTLVACFDDYGNRFIGSMLSAGGFRTNKIPFGRDGDRAQADAVLPYHMTVFHWGKREDPIYLERVKRIQFTPCSLTATGVSVRYAEEGSLLLYLEIVPGDGYEKLRKNIEAAIDAPTSFFLHTTLAVSQNHSEIYDLKKHIENQVRFPFDLTVDSLKLFHIWEPVELVATFGQTT